MMWTIGQVLMVFVALMVAAEAATAVESQGPGLTVESGIDEILDALDRRGTDLEDFQAQVRLTEEDPRFGASKARLGRVWYQTTGEGDSRIRVTFEKREEGGVVADDRIEYLLEDGWLLDRDYGRRSETRRQVLRPGERVDLLKLGEGPFPLPIGQDRQEVHRLFVVEKLDGGEDPPANTVHLRLKPREGTQFARQFHSIDVWVDLETEMPARIETVDERQAGIRTTDLSEVRVNTGLGDREFRLPQIDERRWQRRDEPFGE